MYHMRETWKRNGQYTRKPKTRPTKWRNRSMLCGRLPQTLSLCQSKTITRKCKKCKSANSVVELLVWHSTVDFSEVGSASGRTKGCCVSPSFVNPPHPKASSYAKKCTFFGQLAKISDSSPPSWMSDGTLYKQKNFQNVLTGGYIETKSLSIFWPFLPNNW